MSVENQTYEYFISYMYVAPSGETRMANGSVTRNTPISSYDDLKELQKDIDKKCGNLSTTLISYQLISINKGAHLS